MRMGQGVKTGLGHGGITCVLQTQFSSFIYFYINLQWWPRTSGGRLRFAHAITHLLRHRFGHFVNSNK